LTLHKKVGNKVNQEKYKKDKKHKTKFKPKTSRKSKPHKMGVGQSRLGSTKIGGNLSIQRKRWGEEVNKGELSCKNIKSNTTSRNKKPEKTK